MLDDRAAPQDSDPGCSMDRPGGGHAVVFDGVVCPGAVVHGLSSLGPGWPRSCAVAPVGGAVARVRGCAGYYAQVLANQAGMAGDYGGSAVFGFVYGYLLHS